MLAVNELLVTALTLRVSIELFYHFVQREIPNLISYTFFLNNDIIYLNIATAELLVYPT